MSKVHITVGILLLTAGCSAREEPLGPGRFSISAILKTSAPWDGQAIQLLLCENPLKGGEPTTPYVSVFFYKGAADLSGKRIHLGATESREGNAQWSSAPKEGGPLSSVEVTFETIREGVPVEGTYDLTFPDGTRERGRFKATWLPAQGRGG